MKKFAERGQEVLEPRVLAGLPSRSPPASWFADIERSLSKEIPRKRKEWWLKAMTVKNINFF